VAVFGVICGLGLPLAMSVFVLHLAGTDAVSSSALLAASATLNSGWPLGGGMAFAGCYRTRLGRWEWTFDAGRSRGERFLGPFTLAGVTLGGFVAGLPVLAIAWNSVEPSGLVRELSAIGTLLLLMTVGWIRHRPELPLARWRRELGQTLLPDPAVWSPRLRSLARLAKSDGAIGHTGGIGAATVGLHEHVEAVEILESLARAGFDGAAELHARALGHLLARREHGGFPPYPGGCTSPILSERAEGLLRRSGNDGEQGIE